MIGPDPTHQLDCFDPYRFAEDFEKKEAFMGGYGSGRKATNKCRPTVGSFTAINANVLKRGGVLRSGARGTLDVPARFQSNRTLAFETKERWLCLTHTVCETAGATLPIRQTIEIVEKPCRLGGSRPYLRCHAIQNGVTCNRLAVKLLWQGRYFICRRCCGARYASQNEVPWVRARHRAIDAAAKLGGNAQTKWWQVPKPKGMHWQTYS